MKTKGMVKTIIIQLTEEEFGSLRSAAGDRLNNLGEADMDDPALRQLIRRITRIGCRNVNATPSTSARSVRSAPSAFARFRRRQNRSS